MPRGNPNLQLLNHYAQQRFPLASRASGRDVSDTIELPDDFLVWLDFPVSLGLAVSPELFYVSSVTILSTGVTVEISYHDGVDDPIAATVSVPRSTHTQYRYYTVIGAGDFEGSVGKLAVGNFTNVDTLPAGRFEFDYAGGVLEPGCIRPVVRGVSGMRLVDGSDVSRLYTGDITLLAGSNIRFVVTEVDGGDTRIRIDAISGENLNEDCECDEADTGIPIRFINGLAPNSEHNYRLLGDDCLQITAITNGLQLADACSKPCCRCTELEAVQANASRLVDGAATLKQFLKTLGAEITQMRNSLLGSKLGDDACETCE